MLQKICETRAFTKSPLFLRISRLLNYFREITPQGILNRNKKTNQKRNAIEHSADYNIVIEHSADYIVIVRNCIISKMKRSLPSAD